MWNQVSWAQQALFLPMSIRRRIKKTKRQRGAFIFHIFLSITSQLSSQMLIAQAPSRQKPWSQSYLSPPPPAAPLRTTWWHVRFLQGSAFQHLVDFLSSIFSHTVHCTPTPSQVFYDGRRHRFHRHSNPRTSPSPPSGEWCCTGYYIIIDIALS